MSSPERPFVTAASTADTPASTTTYRMADGSLIWGDYATVGDTEYFTEHDVYDPTHVIREDWVLVKRTHITFLPQATHCEVGDDCEEDASGWRRNDNGKWEMACQEHGGVHTEQFETEASDA